MNKSLNVMKKTMVVLNHILDEYANNKGVSSIDLACEHYKYCLENGFIDSSFDVQDFLTNVGFSQDEIQEYLEKQNGTTNKGVEISSVQDIIDYLTYECNVRVHQYDKEWELEFWSDLGEDVVVYIEHDNTTQSIIDGINEYADNFDAEEHAEVWIDRRGRNGVPNSVRDLIEDAESIKSFLTDIANELSNAHIIEETQELNIQEDIEK